MKIFLDFSNPTLISTGINFDILEIQVINGSDFISLNTKTPMNELLSGFNQTQI